MARRRHSGRRRRGSLSFLYKLLSMLVICGAIVAALTLFFRVNTVVVSGQQRYTQQQILDASGIQTGDNLFLLNKYDVANQIIGELPYIETIRINRKLPDTLLVEVQECSAVLAVVQENNAWLVSPTGKIVDRKAAAAADQYPIIDGCTLLSPSVGSSLALGTKYARKQESLLSLLGQLDQEGLMDQVDAVHLGEADVLTMDYAGRFQVEMHYHTDYSRDIRALLKTIEKLETNETGTIELTWDDGSVHFIGN